MAKVIENPRALAAVWKEQIEEMADADVVGSHPRVAKKVMENVKKWAGTDNLDEALEKLARELLERKKKRPQLLSAKIALTYRKYLYNYYGSMVKFYADGDVVYRDKNTIEGYGFVIYEGEEV